MLSCVGCDENQFGLDESKQSRKNLDSILEKHNYLKFVKSVGSKRVCNYSCIVLMIKKKRNCKF